MSDNNNGNNHDSRSSRRKFFAVPAAAAAAAATFSAKELMAETAVPTISIPKTIPDSMGEALKAPTFEGRGMTGAEVFAKLCKEEELAALFCCPGNYTVINAIAAAGIPAYGGANHSATSARPRGVSRAPRGVSAPARPGRARAPHTCAHKSSPTPALAR